MPERTRNKGSSRLTSNSRSSIFAVDSSNSKFFKCFYRSNLLLQINFSCNALQISLLARLNFLQVAISFLPISSFFFLFSLHFSSQPQLISFTEIFRLLQIQMLLQLSQFLHILRILLSCPNFPQTLSSFFIILTFTLVLSCPQKIE